MERIKCERENRMFLSRFTNAKPFYNETFYKKDWVNFDRYLSNISVYPFTLRPLTTKFGNDSEKNNTFNPNFGKSPTVMKMITSDDEIKEESS